MTLPLILCIDVEPDGFFIDPHRRDPWHGFEATVALVESQRVHWERLIDGPVHANWFLRMDAQVAQVYGDAAWVLRRYEREFATLQAHGDELGLHPHPYRWHAGQARWILDYGDQAWLSECIEATADTFATATGCRCRSFRCGDRFMNQETATLVARLGFEYDLTLEPGYREEPLPYPPDQVTGSLPDLRGAPVAPYRARTDDYRRPDAGATRGPWMVPITTASIRPSLLRRAYQALRYPGRRFDVWTALLSLAPSLFGQVVGAALARGALHLALPLRTGAMVDGRSQPRIEANLAWLSRLMATRPCAMATPAEAVTRIASPTET